MNSDSIFLWNAFCRTFVFVCWLQATIPSHTLTQFNFTIIFCIAIWCNSCFFKLHCANQHEKPTENEVSHLLVVVVQRDPRVFDSLLFAKWICKINSIRNQYTWQSVFFCIRLLCSFFHIFWKICIVDCITTFSNWCRILMRLKHSYEYYFVAIPWRKHPICDAFIHWNGISRIAKTWRKKVKYK